MLAIDTNRLTILPLDQSLLEISLSDFNEMEKVLGLVITDRKLSDREKNVYKIRLKSVENNPIQYI